MKLIAEVPYADGKSYKFYEDRFVDDDLELLYTSIDGYAYLLTNQSQSINFIPLANSVSYVIRLYADGVKHEFGKANSNVMLFKTNRQRTTKIIYEELVQCIEALIAPHVFRNALRRWLEDTYITIGGLTIDQEYLTCKKVFGTKSIPIEEYWHTEISQGQVNVYTTSKKIFYSCQLDEYNAPLMGPLLDMISGRTQQDGE